VRLCGQATGRPAPDLATSEGLALVAPRSPSIRRRSCASAAPASAVAGGSFLQLRRIGARHAAWSGRDVTASR
jgi:hypothetical protein